MAVLVLFALVAGAATALSPCILPVLPIALSAAATGGRRRPLGVVLGLTTSFTAATVLLVYVIDGLGLPDSLVRDLAIATLILFGLTLLLPAWAARVEGQLSRVTARMPVPALHRADGGADPDSSGFGSGFVIGLSLGVVYAPCAGPILAAVITTSAAQSLTGERVAVALAYGLGTGVVLYALMLGGRRLAAPLVRRSGRVQQAMGLLMVLLGAGMIAGADVRFQQEIAAHLPAAVVNPTGSLEADATEGRLTALRGTKVDDVPVTGQLAGPVEEAGQLPDLGAAKEFAGRGRWFNTPGGRPLTLAELRGKVVLVDFWTYSCINCIRTFPELRALDAAYRRHGLVIVGVHAPEFAFERDAGNVEAAVRSQGLRYPVVQDNAFKTWDAYGNLYWPASYLIDARGRLRFRRAGEGGAAAKEAAIRALLRDAGARSVGAPVDPEVPRASSGVLTPESYLGGARGARITGARGERLPPGRQVFAPLPRQLRGGFLAFSGAWVVRPEFSVAGNGAALAVQFRARRVYLVMTTATGAPARADVLLDGRPLTAARGAGRDLEGGAVAVREQRLYTLVDLPEVRTGRLEVRPEPGVRVFAFTFG